MRFRSSEYSTQRILNDYRTGMSYGGSVDPELVAQGIETAGQIFSAVASSLPKGKKAREQELALAREQARIAEAQAAAARAAATQAQTQTFVTSQAQAQADAASKKKMMIGAATGGGLLILGIAGYLLYRRR